LRKTTKKQPIGANHLSCTGGCATRCSGICAASQAAEAGELRSNHLIFFTEPRAKLFSSALKTSFSDPNSQLTNCLQLAKLSPREPGHPMALMVGHHHH
jgi:hypothetical protein